MLNNVFKIVYPYFLSLLWIIEGIFCNGKNSCLAPVSSVSLDTQKKNLTFPNTPMYVYGSQAGIPWFCNVVLILFDTL